AEDMLVYQSMQRAAPTVAPIKTNYDFFEQAHFEQPGYPKMFFIEHEYANDWTNWWAPNAACSAAMLRSAGFQILEQPDEEVFICRRGERPKPWGAVYPAKSRTNGAGKAER